MIRKTVHYSGNVQGVGFRWTARAAAEGFDVTGYVKNLSDGRVELVAEGEAATVDAFIEDVADRMSGCIRETKISQTAASGEFGGFDIRY